MPDGKIDRDRLRAAIRKLGNEYVFLMLDDAIDLLTQPKLVKLVGKYLDVAKLRPDSRATSGSLLGDVEVFEKASLQGKYYESFNVNSKNYMEKSAGTLAWIAGYNRLVGQCIETKTAAAAELRDAFEKLFGLLRHIDEGHDDVIFFADEAGSWQVGVDWGKAFPAWFACLSATADPEEFGHLVSAVVDEFEEFNREKHLATARRIATPPQKSALKAVGRPNANSRQGTR